MRQTEGRLRAPIMIGASLLFWGTFATVQAVHVFLTMLSHGHSLVRLIAYEWVVFLFWVAATPLIAFLARRYSLIPWRWRSAAVHALVAVVLTTLHTGWFVAMRIALRPYDELTPLDFRSSFEGLYSTTFALDVLIYLVTLGAIHAFDYHERSRERALRAATLERELARARLDALGNQLQPHFLYNALHTVSGLIRGREYSAAISTIAGLSDLLRYSLDTSGAQEATLAEEIEAARRYLAIQELRHRDRLVVTVDVDPETRPARVPRLLLQPLVENAIRHGVAPSADPAWLAVRTARRNESLRIEVANSVCSAGDPERGFGIGLGNTRERLDRMYGADYSMAAEGRDGTFEVTIVIPWRTGDPDPADG